MADSFNEEVVEDAQATAGADDVEMIEGATTAAGTENPNNNKNDSELPFAEGVPEDPVPERVTFVQYLSSPVVTLLIGSGEKETILTAHQGLLVQSPYFADACAEFADDGSVCTVSGFVAGVGRGGCPRAWLRRGELCC
jgi:hypothetical protein